MSFRGTRSSHPVKGALIGLLVAVLAALVLAPGGQAFAHSNHDHKMYVATTGRDVGDCDQPWLPCRTIRYAIQRAIGQGSEVRVAAGDYFFDAREVVQLVGRQVPVHGGYTLRDGYAAQNQLNNPTYISGIPARYRQKLREHGFGRVEDRDRVEDRADVAPGGPEVVIPTELATPLVRQNCSAGMAGIFPCSGMDFLGSVALSQFNSATDGSNLWGHVDLNTGREYAVIGVNTGTGVVDVTDPINPVVIGTVPGIDNIWREVKVYQFFNSAQSRWNAYAYISTEAGAQGLQIIDLNHLSDASPTVSLANTVSSDFGSSHTVYIKNVDYALNTALPGKTAALYMNGTNKNGGVFRAFNLASPLAPTLIGPPTANTAYTHDSTSMIITDSRTSQCVNGHNPCELLFDFRGSQTAANNRLNIWDVTDAAAPVRISSTPYSGSRYTHSGWYSNDKMYVFIQDELDETGLGHNTLVRTLDISNLLAPTISASWSGPTKAIDHNGYTIGNKYYMSNYRRGLTVLDVTNPNAITQRAFFDTFPGSDSAAFNAAWGVYPFLPSGNLLISDIERGLIIVRESDNSTTNQVVAGLSVASSSPTVLGATTAFTTTIATGTNVAYAWNFGDGSPVASGGSSLTHSYASAATYTVLVTATNTINSASATTSVTVNGPEQAIAGLSVASNGPTTLGASTAFTATISAGTNVAYAWNFGDGSPVASGGSSLTHSYASAATYTVLVTATNTINSASASTSVTINAIPDLAIAGLSVASNGPTALGASTAFTATISAGTNVTYAWNFGDGSPVVSGGSSLTHSYASAATYTVLVTATNTINSASATTSVTVQGLPFLRWLPFITAWIDGAPATAQQHNTLGVARLAQSDR